MASDSSTPRRPRVIWINIDGLNADALYGQLDEGALPNLGRIFANPARVKTAVSVFPTVAMSCHATLATGSFPGKHELIANTWFDRFAKTPKYRNYAEINSALSIYGLKFFGAPTALLPPRAGPSLANSDLSGSTHTIYEEVSLRSVRSAVIFNQISRGARDWVRPNRLDIAQFSLCHDDHLEFSHFDRTAAKRMAAHIERVRKLPRLFMAYYPGLDGHTHRHGAKSQPGYLRTVLDPLIGMLLENLSDRRPIEDFTFVLTSDHGHAEVTPDKQHQVTPEEVAAILHENGRTPFHGSLNESPRRFDSIIMPQGGSCHIILKNAKSHHWYDLPRFRNDLITTSLSLMDASQSERLNLPPGWIDIILIKDQDAKRYLVMRGHKLYDPEKFFASEAHREKYPDAMPRLAGYFSRRSADIVLLADYDKGFHFSGGRVKHSQHGNLSRHDSLVPMLFAGKGIRKCTIPRASIVDVAPTIAEMFATKLHSAEGKALNIFQKKPGLDNFPLSTQLPRSAATVMQNDE